MVLGVCVCVGPGGGGKSCADETGGGMGLNVIPPPLLQLLLQLLQVLAPLPFSLFLPGLITVISKH